MESKKIKNIILSVLVIIFTSTIAIKVCDLLIGQYIHVTYSDNIISKSPRFVNLREIGLNQSASVTPTDKYISDTNGLEKKAYQIKINKDGFITSSQYDGFKSDKVDIIFLGGSTTESFYVDEEKRFPSSVGIKLTKELNKEIKSINAGHSGNHSLHSLFNFLAKGIKYSPKIVIMMHNINDWSLLSRTGNYWIAPETRSIIVNPLNKVEQSSKTRITLKKIKDLLIPNSWILIRELGLVSKIKVLSSDEFEGYDIFRVAIEDSSILFKSSLESFIAISRSWDIEPVLMTQMHMFEKNNDQKNNDQMLMHQNRYNEIIRNVAGQNNVFLIDLDKELSGKSDLMYDLVHLNNKGSKEAANIIVRNLIKNYSEILISLEN